MSETAGITRLLVRHFFRRFFDNDTLHLEGDTTTAVIRALSVVAIPGLLIAFFLQNQYPRRPLWGSIADQYFFVLFSFVVMGAVAVFEWDMLFPDRLDFLVLSPLSLRPTQLFAGRAGAVLAFFSLFLLGANVLGNVMLPLISHSGFFRQCVAHAAAVLLGGAFAALFVLALGGVLLCLLPPAAFGVVSPLLRLLAIAALGLLLLHYARYGDSLEPLLTTPLGRAADLPPFWFLGIYEHLLHGTAAPAFARPMAIRAVRATAIAAMIVFATYPLAWTRMRRLAIEGISPRRTAPSRLLARSVAMLIHHPAGRAVFHFIGQTLARNTQYGVYLAIYLGTGTALAITCATSLEGTVVTLNQNGLHALMPLLLFWIIAGLRAAFAFPLALSARWVFRVSGAPVGECLAASARWALLCAFVTTLSLVALLAFAGWSTRLLLVQTVCGANLSLLLTSLFFASQRGIPFNQPRAPGSTSFPLVLTLYIGVLPLFILGVVRLEAWMEAAPSRLILPSLAVLAIYLGLRHLTRHPPQPEEELEGYDGEFQILGL